MKEVLEEIPIGAAPKAALLGKPNQYKEVLDLVVSYKRANWTSMPQLTSRLGIDQNEVSQLYLNALGWVDRAFM